MVNLPMKKKKHKTIISQKQQKQKQILRHLKTLQARAHSYPFLKNDSGNSFYVDMYIGGNPENND